METIKDTEIRLLDDPKLVEYRTDLEGWTGPDKLYYGKGEEGERRARYGNSTHKKCDCGNIYKKDSYCRSCSEKRSKESFLKLEAVEWDGKSMMCLRHDDVFFHEMEEVFEWCENNDSDISEIELMLCEMEVKISEVNIDELNEEYCSGDGEQGVSYHHPEIAEKVEELNELIRNATPKLWFQSNKRIIIPEKLM